MLTWALNVTRLDGRSRIRHLNPMKKNLSIKLVTPTAHRTSQKPRGSTAGLRKIRLRKREGKMDERMWITDYAPSPDVFNVCQFCVLIIPRCEAKANFHILRIIILILFWSAVSM